MPPKRPVPLSDAALGHKGGLGVDQGVFGETNAGIPLPVKNTFIDMPEGTSPSKKTQPISTAPAQVNFAPGFIKRSVLDSVQEATSAAAGVESVPSSSGGSTSPKKSPPFVVQRPGPPLTGGSLLPATPLMTPSPTGSSMFAAARYQLFGGPAPVQEATHSALAPGTGFLAATGSSISSAAHPTSRPILSVPPPAPQSSYIHAQPAGGSPAVPLSFAPPAYPVLTGTVRTTITQQVVNKTAMTTVDARSGPVPGQKQEDSDDDEADSEAERQQELLKASGRTPENAPKPPPGAQHPSLGSSSHEEGSCKRCCFYPRNRCLNGYECEFCHYEHEKRKRKNKKNKKKKGLDQEDFAVDGSASPGRGFGYDLRGQAQPHSYRASLPAGPSSMADIQLTYVWSDGLLGQTPPPPPVPGFAEYLASLGVNPNQGEHALATNAPPPQSHVPTSAPYDMSQQYPGYPPAYPPIPGPELPWLLPYSQPPYYGPESLPPPLYPGLERHFGLDHSGTGIPIQPTVGGPMSYPPPSGDVIQAIEAAAGFAGPAPPPLSSPKLPQRVMFGEPAPPHLPPSVPTPKSDTLDLVFAPITADVLASSGKPATMLPVAVSQAGTQTDAPSMPPPDASPKLGSDLMATLDQGLPPHPDDSPT